MLSTFSFFLIFVHAPRPDNLKVWQMQYWWCSVGIWKKIRGISRCQPDTYVFKNVAQELFTSGSFGIFFVSVRQWSSWKILSSGHVPINSCIHKTYVNLVTAHRLSVKPAQVQLVEIIYKRALLFLRHCYETYTIRYMQWKQRSWRNTYLKSVNSIFTLAVHSPKLNHARTQFLSHFDEKKIYG